jgi:CRISPR-associated protein Cas2
MFVSIVVDPGGMDSAKALSLVLTRFGFKKVQRACWENVQVTERRLTDLKRELDRATDYYDMLRMYQYPVNGMFAVTELSKKKWKRCLLRDPSLAAAQGKTITED